MKSKKEIIKKVIEVYDQWRILPCPRFTRAGIECEGISKCDSCRNEFIKMIQKEIGSEK